ncbi:brain protein I3-like isoform X3 [Dreissena polymorpha]|nr:brain protein I3-like isoform X3 [Dreissena polymorpha]
MSVQLPEKSDPPPAYSPPKAGGNVYPPMGPGYPPQPGYGYPGQPGYPPPPQGYPGYMPAHQQAAQFSQQSTSVVVVGGQQQATGNCPYCLHGFTKTDFTAIGIVIAILFFPLGVICCMFMTERRCTSCGRVC